MTTMAPPRTAERHGCRVRLATGPAAPAEARRRVRDAIRSWQVPVDLDAALLLTSELVTNAVRHEAGQGAQAVVLAIASSRGRLLVETLSDEWGFYRTPAGKAVYFTLASEPDKADQPHEAPAAGGRGPQRVYARGRWTVTPPSEHRPRRAALAVPAARPASP
jgi:anti-sigma regulatory factor (Ser/Thr protein kinase)